MPTITQHAPEPALESLLNQLEHILGEERRALARLDLSALDQAAADKLALRDALTQSASLTEGNLTARARLERIRSDVVRNQMLLVHVRDTVRGVLELITGSPGQSYGPAGARSIGGNAGLDATG